jgi:hypothetical protein
VKSNCPTFAEVGQVSIHVVMVVVVVVVVAVVVVVVVAVVVVAVVAVMVSGVEFFWCCGDAAMTPIV